MMKTYEIGIGWSNSVDEIFVRLLESSLDKKKIVFREITFPTLARDFEAVINGELHFKTFIDRGSIDNPAFFVIADKLRERGARVVNDPRAVVRSASKADLYKLFRENNLPLPKVVLIQAQTARRKEPDAKSFKRIADKLGVPFTLKLSYGGYENDVMLNASTESDVLDFEEDNRTEDILAQEYVVPAVMDGKIAWFRIIFVCGRVLPLWWDPQNRFYQEFGQSAAESDVAKNLEELTRSIAGLTGLDLFSTEIAIDTSGAYKIMDYANHPIDVNSRGNTPDGLPPKVLEKIVRYLVSDVVSG
jgi:glutathione synthase/RimK-type ligase-like ATP-grasp enzyme